jgi:hypothetical protein
MLLMLKVAIFIAVGRSYASQFKARRSTARQIPCPCDFR